MFGVALGILGGSFGASSNVDICSHYIFLGMLLVPGPSLGPPSVGAARGAIRSQDRVRAPLVRLGRAHWTHWAHWPNAGPLGRLDLLGQMGLTTPEELGTFRASPRASWHPP